MRTKKSRPQRIKHERGDQDAWVCLCGNRPWTGGFYPCDSEGNEMEPLIGSNWAGLYVCADCGRTIDQRTRRVLGRNPRPKFLD